MIVKWLNLYFAELNFKLNYKNNGALHFFLLLSLILLYSYGYSATQTYYITTAVNLTSSACGTAGAYNCTANAQIGFNWTDNLPACSNVTAVSIQFKVGIECNPGSRVTRLNGVSQGNVTTTAPSNGCNCALASNMPVITKTLNVANYVVGGANTFRIHTGSSCMGLNNTWNSNRYAIVTVTYTAGGACCYTGVAAETSHDHIAASGCNAGSFTLGGGAYYNLAVEQNTYYMFTFTESASNINGFCATNVNGNANDFNTNQTSTSPWFSGTTTSLKVAAIRSSSTWTNTSATMTYQRVTPVLQNNNSPTSASICTGGTVAIANTSSVTFGDRYWQGTTNNGTSRSTTGSPNNATSGGTWRYRPYNGNPANNNGCWGTQKNTTVTEVADPTPPTAATKSPNVASVCVGQAVSVSSPTGGDAGVSGCSFQYRFQRGTTTVQDWSATASYTTVSADAGNTINVQIRRSGCTGSGCTATSSASGNLVSWSVAGPPSTATAGSNQTICSSQIAILAANTPTSGSGTWSVFTGPNLSSVQFSNTASPTSTFTPAGGTGSYTLRWTISNSPCSSEASDVIITVNGTQTSSTWDGSVSTDWFDHDNWNNCIPGNITDVTIPNTVNKPDIGTGQTGSCRTISIDTDSGAEVDIIGTGTLNIAMP